MKRYLIEIIVIVIILANYSIAAYQRNFVWKDELSLCSDVVKKSPNKARPYTNLAVACGKRGLIDRAISLAKKSIALDPNPAEPHNSLGICYFEKKWVDKAISEFQHAISIKPDHADARYNLGVAYGSK